MSTNSNQATPANPSSGSQWLTTWRDFTITPAIVISTIITPAIFLVWQLNQVLAMSYLESLVAFYMLGVAFTLGVLKLLRTLFPLADGVYSYAMNTRDVFLFNNYTFMLVVILGPFYTTTVIPPILRKEFYNLLGCKMGRGMMVIGGKMEDPHWVQVGDNVIIADDTMVYPHVVTNGEFGGDRFLAIGRIEIGNHVVIGNRCTIMPGVKIGDWAMLAANTFVPMDTVIPPGEIWSGNPAQKIGEVPRKDV